MATHSTILAWSIPWTEEPRGLQFQSLSLAASAPPPPLQPAQSSQHLDCREEKDPEIHSQNINFFGFISISSFTHFLSELLSTPIKRKKKKKRSPLPTWLPGSNDK